MTTIDLNEVEKLADQLPPHEQLALIQHLTQQIRAAMTGPGAAAPKSLYGMWKGAAPDNLDVEKAIRDIRDEWKSELDEYST
jgi:hypothetical protein